MLNLCFPLTFVTIRTYEGQRAFDLVGFNLHDCNPLALQATNRVVRKGQLRYYSMILRPLRDNKAKQ